MGVLSHGDVSTRTRRAYAVSNEGVADIIFKVSSEVKILIEYLLVLFSQLEDISSIDFVGKLLGLNDIYTLLVKSSMSIQMVNNFPWEYTCALEN